MDDQFQTLPVSRASIEAQTPIFTSGTNVQSVKVFSVSLQLVMGFLQNSVSRCKHMSSCWALTKPGQQAQEQEQEFLHDNKE